MKVLIFGATGMVGQAALRESLLAPDVTLVQAVGRTPTGRHDPKLREIVHASLLDLSDIEDRLAGFDAVFFCVGVASPKMSEAEYTRRTFELTLSVAGTLVRVSPDSVFLYMSGAGADSSETSRTMWERVRGRTENALLRLPFRRTLILRPAMIRPLDGIKSKTPAYRLFYGMIKPLLPLLHAALPRQVVSTRQLGQAMLNAVRHGAPKAVLESADIARLAAISPAGTGSGS